MNDLLELYLWKPESIENTTLILNWLQTSPRKDILGYIQIGAQKPHQITFRNRYVWEKILFDFLNELREMSSVE